VDLAKLELIYAVVVVVVWGGSEIEMMKIDY
jgi:hypothetical protein